MIMLNTLLRLSFSILINQKMSEKNYVKKKETVKLIFYIDGLGLFHMQ